MFGDRPFANYGCWTSPGQTMAQAAEALTRLLAESAQLASGDQVLDVGCGYGAGAVVFARDYGVARVSGIDVTEVCIAEGQRYVAAQMLKSVARLRELIAGGEDYVIVVARKAG